MEKSLKKVCDSKLMSFSGTVRFWLTFSTTPHVSSPNLHNVSDSESTIACLVRFWRSFQKLDLKKLIKCQKKSHFESVFPNWVPFQNSRSWWTIFWDQILNRSFFVWSYFKSRFSKRFSFLSKSLQRFPFRIKIFLHRVLFQKEFWSSQGNDLAESPQKNFASFYL